MTRIVFTLALLAALIAPAHARHNGQPTPGCSQATTYLARTSGYTTAQQAAYTALICGMVADGSWAQMEVFYTLNAPNSSGMALNLTSTSYSLTTSGTGTFTATQGWAGNGSTGYLNTNYTPSTNGVQCTLNSCGIGIYDNSSVTTGDSQCQIGTGNAAATSNLFFCDQYSTGSGFILINDATFSATSGANSLGFWYFNRTASAAEGGYYSGISNYSDSASSVATCDLPVFIGAINSSSGAALFSNHQISIAFISNGTLTGTQIIQLYTRIATFLQAMGTGNAKSSSSLSSIFSGAAASTLPKFGVSTHNNTQAGSTPNILPATNVALANQIGASVLRSDVPWDNTEPVTPGTYVWTYESLSTLVTDTIAAGITFHGILAYSNPAVYSAGPYNLTSLFTGPANSNAVTVHSNWAAAAITQFGATGTEWEEWNEENISNGAGNYSWSAAASAANYSTMLNSDVTAMRAISTSTKIMTGGLALGGGSGYVTPNTYIASVVADATLTNVEWLGLHPYNSGDAAAQIPELAITQSSSFSSAASAAKPIAWTEVGYTTGTSAPTVSNQTRKGIFDARLMLSAVVAQVPEVVIYDLISDGPMTTDATSNYGLYTYGCATISGFICQQLPAGAAFAGVTANLRGCSTIDASQIAANSIWEITCHVTGGVRRIIWTAYGSYNFTSAESSITSAIAHDLYGNNVPVTVSSTNATFNMTDIAGPVVLTVRN